MRLLGASQLLSNFYTSDRQESFALFGFTFGWEGASGDVVLDAVIDTEGVVADVGVIDSPHQSLSASAEMALRQWRFEPERNKDGKPIEVRFNVTVQFHSSDPYCE